jgi:hypothetical protein
MPETIAAAIIQATGTSLTVAQVATAIKVAFVAAQIGYSVNQAGKAKAAARAAYNASLSDRNVTLRGGDLPHEIVYGRVRKSTALWYATNQVVGPQEQYLWMVLGVAGHQCAGIGEIYLDADPIGPLDVNGDTTGGKFFKVRTETRVEQLALSPGLTLTTQHPIQTLISVSVPNGGGDGPIDIGLPPASYSFQGSTIAVSGYQAGAQLSVAYTYVAENIPLVRVKKYLGGPGQVADADLIAASNGEWDSNSVAPGETYLILRLRFDQVFQTWTQQVSCIVNGKLVFDPRGNTTTYSDNAALCVADYLRDALGFELAATEIDTLLLVAAANISDESVPINGTGGTQKRYTCNAVLSTEAPLRDNLEILLKAMAGSATPVQGKFRLFAGAYRTPDLVLNEADIDESGDDTVVPALGEADGFNSIKGKFSDETRLWQPQDYPSYSSSVFVAEDQGRVRYADFDLEAVSHPARATRLAKLRLFRSRNALTFEARFKLTAYNTMPGKTVALVFPTFGWNIKVFQVIEREFSFEGWVRLVLQEDVATDYDWSYTEYPGAAQVNNTNLPDPGVVPAVTGLTAQSGAAFMRVLSDGSQQAQIRLSWAAPNNSTVTQGGFVDIEYMRITESIWTRMPALRGDQTSVLIEPVSRLQRYLIRVRFRNGLGVTSTDWTFITHDVDASAGATTSVSVNGVGVNLLENASLRYGPTGWRVQWADGTNADMPNGQGVQKGQEYFQCQNGFGTSPSLFANEAPRPLGVLRYGDESTATYGDSNRVIYSAQAMNILPGERIELQARGCSQGSMIGQLQAIWYDANDNWLSSVVPVGGPDSVTAAEASGLNTLSNYKHLWGFAVAPANAHRVRFGFNPRKPTVANGFTRFAAPYLGRAHAGQVRPSPWTGDQSVGTGLIEPEAATQAYNWDGPIPTGQWRRLESIFMQTGWKVEGTFNVSVSGQSSGPPMNWGTRGSFGSMQLWLIRPDLSGYIYGGDHGDPGSVQAGVGLFSTGTVSFTYTVEQTGNHQFGTMIFGDNYVANTFQIRSERVQATVIKR